MAFGHQLPFVTYFFLVATVICARGSVLRQRSISQDLFNDFVRFVNFSSGAYQASCPSPVGSTLVTAVRELGLSYGTQLTDTLLLVQ